MTNSLPQIQAVIFDMDGLMFNTEDVFELSGTELVRRRGFEMTPELRNQMMGRRAKEAFDAMIQFLNLNESAAALQEESEELFESYLDDHLAPMPGLFQLLEHIEQHQLPKGVATSSSRSYLEEILGRFELLSRFDHTLTAEDVSRGKPEPEIYLKAAAHFEIDPSQMLVLEDSGAGTAAASAAGAVTVSIPHHHSASQNFEPATYIAESLIDPFILKCISG
ncbi:conserved hypothetical protein-putative phosphatase [hydrothermal vent metagenome]|uniref:Phosphorylated carbohydrates phosphatase n=1 Tax=hydrothermal vent metagenome TaxID=652676 RepID=A0A3B1E7M9_9ZZZZ